MTDIQSQHKEKTLREAALIQIILSARWTWGIDLERQYHLLAGMYCILDKMSRDECCNCWISTPSCTLCAVEWIGSHYIDE